MVDNVNKTPFMESIQAYTTTKLDQHFRLHGKSLPCSVVAVNGPIVTVQFEVNSTFTFPNVAVPVAQSIYVRLPVQIGDKGIVRPVDTYLGGVSGLGGGVADLTRPANLEALVFEPIANKNWPACDGNAVVINQGPNGVVLSDAGGKCVFTLTPDGITITIGGLTFTLNGSGWKQSGGEVQAGTHTLTKHSHSDPQGGSVGAPEG